MTTPASEYGMLWMVATPKETGIHKLLVIDARQGGGTSTGRVRLPVGVNTVMVSWTGSKSGLSLQFRDPANTVYRSAAIPDHTSAVQRTIVTEIAVPEVGYDLTFSAHSIEAGELGKAVAGVKIIPSDI